MRFTYSEYEAMLTTLLKDYEFISFSRAKFSREKMERKVLLRHDIDQSLEKTKRIAEIEAGLGISSTYFLLFRSPFYNMFSADQENYIRAIIGNNHFIGLHFDYTGYSFNTISQLAHQVILEADFIQQYFNVKVDAVSFHRPLDINYLKKLELTLYPHAYESIFIEQYKYFADSRGRWRFGNPLESEAFRQKQNLQILVHPEWWNETELKSLQSVDNYRRDYLTRFEKDLQKELKGFWDALSDEEK
jgi:hypothetical protein